MITPNAARASQWAAGTRHRASRDCTQSLEWRGEAEGGEAEGWRGGGPRGEQPMMVGKLKRDGQGDPVRDENGDPVLERVGSLGTTSR